MKLEQQGDKNYRVLIYWLEWIYASLHQGKTWSLENRGVTSNKAGHVYHVWPDKLQSFLILLFPWDLLINTLVKND